MPPLQEACEDIVADNLNPIFTRSDLCLWSNLQVLSIIYLCFKSICFTMICLFLPKPMPVIVPVSVHTLRIPLLIFGLLVATARSPVPPAVPPLTTNCVVVGEARPLSPVPSEREETLHHHQEQSHILTSDLNAITSEEEDNQTGRVSLPLFLILWTPATGRSPLPGGRGRSPSR
jgi:hypothetical protein